MSDSDVLIEVCVDSVESAQAAVQGGASRLEVCGNIATGGGSTPSVGLVLAIAHQIPDVPLMIMIRPRVGSFVYSSLELGVIHRDIDHFCNLCLQSLRGFVCGFLNSDGTVDEELTAELAKDIIGKRGLECEAFDMVPSQSDALQTLKRIGVTRILTSGGYPSLAHPSAIHSLTSLLTPQGHNPLSPSPTILPGSGISRHSASPILHALFPLGVREIHMSGGRWVTGGVCEEARASKEGMGFGAGEGAEREWGIWRTDEESVRGVKEEVVLFLREVQRL